MGLLICLWYASVISLLFHNELLAQQTKEEKSTEKHKDVVKLMIPSLDVFLPRKDVVDYWAHEMRTRDFKKILEVGPGGIDRNFEPATHVVDFDPLQYNDVVSYRTEEPAADGSISAPRVAYNVDIDEDPVPASDDSFDFVYCRHVLEDLHSPVIAFREITRLSRRGYIETPSPMLESVYMVYSKNPYPGRGFIHHRYLIWTEHSTNTLMVLPKYPILDFMAIPRESETSYASAIMQDLIFMNTYYTWDKDDPNKQPAVKVLKHAVDYNLIDTSSYWSHIFSGSEASVNSTQIFFEEFINPFMLTQEGSV